MSDGRAAGHPSNGGEVAPQYAAAIEPQAILSCNCRKLPSAQCDHSLLQIDASNMTDKDITLCVAHILSRGTYNIT